MSIGKQEAGGASGSKVLRPERWAKLRPLLEVALDADTDAQSAFVDAVRRDDADIAFDLERLLANAAGTHALDEPIGELIHDRVAAQLVEGGDSPAARHLERRIGPFVLKRLIGEGGMGAVYEGERVEGGFTQRVAIKLITGMHPGLDQRFARERQILAGLRHPNIPQLFDGGETEDGLSYLILEYVEGTSLLRYVEDSAADLDERLALLEGIAEALRYAHRERVLHRDIKPGNILVSHDGEVKLLDFGIAKLLDGALGSSLTQQVTGPMTPEFASPEQFNGQSLGPESDIYQFGVLMFRLLSGQAPYRVASEDGLAFAKAVCDEPPRTLMSALPAEAFESIPTRWRCDRRHSLRQSYLDLDRIVRRCLEKAPQRRYRDFAALLDDLAAVRGGLVPQASLGYRRRKACSLALQLGVLAILLGVLAWLVPWPTLYGSDEWSDTTVLGSMGLSSANLHTSTPAAQAQIRHALLAEARGDLNSAMALLEAVHASDPQTPVPAILLGYWTRGDRTVWRGQARERLAQVDDAYLRLLFAFTVNESEERIDEALMYAAAILELKPDAWFMRFARSRLLGTKGLEKAALRELQAITPRRLDHYRLVDAIADRAAMGDMQGGREMLHQLQAAEDDPLRALLGARLQYSEGDLQGAYEGMQRVVVLARDVAHFEVEARAWMYQAAMAGTLHDLGQATMAARQARVRFLDLGITPHALDATLMLAQIAAIEGDKTTLAEELATAEKMLAQDVGAGARAYAELVLSRLRRGRAPDPELADGDTARFLMEARRSLVGGDTARTRYWLAMAHERNVETSRYAEEYAFLCRDADARVSALGSIDPLFPPFARFAARWALQAHATVAPLAATADGPVR